MFQNYKQDITMKKKGKSNFEKWCAKERKNRPEKGSSQDMCPTNGDALFMRLCFGLMWLLVFCGLIVSHLSGEF